MDADPSRFRRLRYLLHGSVGLAERGRQCLERLSASGSGMDGQTPETSNMPQQQPQQQQANVSQNVQGFASTTNLDASSQGHPVQGSTRKHARTGTSMV